MKNRHEIDVHNISSSSRPRAVKSRKTAYRAKLAEQQAQRGAPVVNEAVCFETEMSLDQMLAEVESTDFEALLARGAESVPAVADETFLVPE